MGCAFRGGRQGGEVNVWAYMKEFLKYFSKTDPCACEFRQRSIVAPYMGMCALNTRPLQELKFAIYTPPGDTFRGVPRGEFLSRGGTFLAHASTIGKGIWGSDFRERGVPNSRMHAQACPLVT